MKQHNGLIKKGEVRNPNGRPKGSVSLIQILRDKLNEQIPEEEFPGQKKIYAEKMIDILVEKAVKKEDFVSIREILDRTEGKPHQTTSSEIKGDLGLGELLKRLDGQSDLTKDK